MSTSKLELLLEGGADRDDAAVHKTLEHLRSMEGVRLVAVQEGALIVESALPSSVLAEAVERISGRRTVLQGFGETESCVAMVSAQACCVEDAIGVVRFQQTRGGALAADGALDGLAPGRHALTVHAAGDLTQGCESLGEVYGGAGGAGQLGCVEADSSGRATFRILVPSLQVAEIVGRSLRVSAALEPGADWRASGSAGCGVIARSAGVLANPKRVCACDGVVVWDERERPAAGRARRDPASPAATAPAACCRR